MTNEAKAAPALEAAGVFKGAWGLVGLLNAQDFWDNRPYGTRLYYGSGVGDYLHRDVLGVAVKIVSEKERDRALIDAGRQMAKAVDYLLANGGLWDDLRAAIAAWDKAEASK